MKKNLTFIAFGFLAFPLVYGANLDLDTAIKTSESLLTNAFSSSWTSQTWTLTPTNLNSTGNDDLILKLHEKGLTIHKTRSDFKPEKNIRRDEAAKMLTLSLIHLPQPATFTAKAKGSCMFKDLNKARPDLKAVVLKSCDKGLFKGSNDLFKPDHLITNGQLMTVLGRMLFGMQEEDKEHYASAYIELLGEKGYLEWSDLTQKTTWNEVASRGTLANILGKVLEK